jgi:hypothetical protein
LAGVALILRLGLAVVFAVAGAAKLADPAGSRRALEQFGARSSIASHLARGLPVVELAIAAGLVGRVSAAWAGGTALLLLSLFLVVLARAVAHGDAPDCHCFGRLHSSSAGLGTLVRNAGLVAAAGVVVAQGIVGSPSDPIGWLRGLGPGSRVGVLVGGLAAIAIGVLAWACLLLLRRYGRLLVRVDELEEVIAASGAVSAEPGPPVMERAPGFSATTLDGRRVGLDSILDRAKLTLMVFADLGCGSCRELLPQVARWQDEHAERLVVAVILSGGPEEGSHLREEYGIERVLLQRDREVAEAYNALGTPSALLLYADGRVARPLALGATRIEALVKQAVTPSTSVLLGRTRPASMAGGIGAAALATNGTAAAEPTANLTSSDPEVQQINNLIMAAQPRLAVAVEASYTALKVLVRRDRLRVSQKVRRRRLKTAENKLRADSQLLTQLRAQVLALSLSGPRGQQAQQVVADMIQLHVSYFDHVRQSLEAPRPKDRIQQAKEAKQLLLPALHRSVDSRFVLTQ